MILDWSAGVTGQAHYAFPPPAWDWTAGEAAPAPPAFVAGVELTWRGADGGRLWEGADGGRVWRGPGQ